MIAVAPYFMTRVGEALTRDHGWDGVLLMWLPCIVPVIAGLLLWLVCGKPARKPVEAKAAPPARAPQAAPPGGEPVTVSIKRANTISVPLFCVSLALLLTLRFLIWRKGFVWPGGARFFLPLLALTPVHEGLHALCAGLFAPNGFKAVTFGVMPAEKLWTCEATNRVAEQVH